MKQFTKYLIVLLLIVVIGIMCACDNDPCANGHSFSDGVCTVCGAKDPDYQAPFVDYVDQLKLDLTSNTLKQEVTVKTFIDGDTTHFIVPSSLVEGGVLKARYLSINTPESTGKIEEYGKTASNFTHTKLENAYKIMIESDDDKLNADSTGGRYLMWVWYKTDANSDWRNLNLEILQNGLAVASNSGQNRYGQICLDAISQAKAYKLNVHSGQKDPNFYYGDAVELTLKELRCNVADYTGIKVAFEGVITRDDSQTVYVEEYDEITDMYYGMTVYYGFSAYGTLTENLAVGNRVRIVGTVQYYEAGGTYQVSGLTYREMKPNDPNNTKLISSGHQPAYKLVDGTTFLGQKSVELTVVDPETEQESIVTKTFDFAELAMSTTVSIKGLTVKSIYTTGYRPDGTKNPSYVGDSAGAMTLTCTTQDGKTIDVRTIVLYDQSGQIVKASVYADKTIDVQGIVDFYEDSYQIKVLSTKDITIK